MRDAFIVNENVAFSMDDKSTGLNNNFSLIGTPGCGKTNLEVYNILKMKERSHVIVDVKGNLRNLTPRFEQEGYKVLCLDLIHLQESMNYNPFLYISCDNWESDIQELSNALYGPAENHMDPYWDQASLSLLRCCLGYMYRRPYANERNLQNVMTLLASFSEIVSSGDDEGENVVRVFDNVLERYCEQYEDYVSLEYKSFSQNAERTKKCIFNNLMTALNPFKSDAVQEMLSFNDFDFETIAKRKTIVLISIKDYDTTLHRIAGLFLTQLLSVLFKQADQQPDSRLPIPVQFWLDDFGSYSVPKFENIISCARSRGIGISIMYQSKAQLASVYGPNIAEIIIQCCDTVIYMGGNDPQTVNDVSLRSGYRTNAIFALKPREAFVMRRGEKVLKEKMVDYEKEPDFCAWMLAKKYKHVPQPQMEPPEIDEMLFR